MSHCNGRLHDPRFVYQIEDDLHTHAVWDQGEDEAPLITEHRREKFECRACLATITSEWHTRQYRPAPSEIIYTAGEAPRHVYHLPKA